MSGKDIHFKESDFEGCSAFLEDYKKQFTIPYDDFLEDFILKSNFYLIEIGSERCGFFGMYNSLLTILFVDDLHFTEGKRIFEEIKKTYIPREAFVPTTDIAVLSIILENYQEIKIQALHFSDTGKVVRSAEFGKEYFRLARLEDLDEIVEIAGDFLEDYEVKIAAQELYVLEEGEEILGIGVLVRNKIMENCVGPGMLTKESKRRLGVGRSIVLHLKEIAYSMGMTPVPGCWYYNTNSRMTLESAGYITKSKLLRVTI